MDILQFIDAQKATMSFGVVIIFVCCILVIIASFIDMWTGIEAARACKEKISSRGLRKTVAKIVDYLRVVVFALLIDILGLFLPWYHIPYCVMICTLGILLIEGWSVIENNKKKKSHAGEVLDMVEQIVKCATNEKAGEIIEKLKEQYNKEQYNVKKH